MSDLLPLFEEQRVEVSTWPDRPRYLMSYAYADDSQVALCKEYGVDLIVDSGAFTVANSGGVVDHDAYLDWLAGHADQISFALSLDVIGDHHTSLVNHEAAAARIGDKVHMVPAWHFGSRFADLEDLCRRYPFVCIGGAVPYAKQPHALFRVAQQAHRIAAAHGTQLHGLGMTGNRILHGLPWYSVDSSAWLAAVRFPSLPLADEHGRIHGLEHGAGYLDPASSRLVTQYGGLSAIVATPGWSLKAHVGTEVSLRRRQWVLTATARSFMYLEAHKAANQPDHPIKVYLSGMIGHPGGAVQAIYDAWLLGNPWATTTTPERLLT